MSRIWFFAAWLCCLPFASLAAEGAGTILIGQVAGVTGPVAGSVQEQISGAEIYLKAINDKGGVLGRHIELRVMDDGFDPKRTPDAARQLIQEGALSLFLVRGTGNAEGILSLLEKEGVPLIAPATGATHLRQPVKRWVFNVRATYQMEVAAAVRHLVTLNINNLAMIHVDDAFGSDALAGFSKVLGEQGLKPAFVSSYKRPMGDITQEVKRFAQVAPGAIFVIGSAAESARFIRQYRAVGGQAQLLTLSNNAAQAFVDELGGDGAGVIVTQVVPDSARASLGIAQEYRRLARDQGKAVSDAGMEGFMSAKVLVEALRRAGKEPTREVLRSTLESMRDFDLGGISIRYSPADHTGGNFVDTSVISARGRLLR